MTVAYPWRDNVASLTSLNTYDTIDGVTEVPISTVAPGYRFQLVFANGKRWPGTVVRHSKTADGQVISTAVILDGLEKVREFTTASGQVVQLKKQGGLQYWSADTGVLRIDGCRDIQRWSNPLKPQGDTTMQEAHEKTASLLGGSKARPSRKAKKAAKAKAAAKPKVAKVAKELNACKCGCGDKVTGNFRQGHDARYYGLLKKVVAEKIPFNQLPKLMQNEAENVAGCKKLLAKHGR